MTPERDTEPDHLQPGLYEHLVTEGLEQALAAISDSGGFVTRELEPEDSHSAIAQYLETVLAGLLASIREGDARERQRSLANRLIAALLEEMAPDVVGAIALAEPLRQLLRSVSATIRHARGCTPKPTSSIARVDLAARTLARQTCRRRRFPKVWSGPARRAGNSVSLAIY